MSKHFIWHKKVPPEREDAWSERLSQVSDRLAITMVPGAKTIRLEVFNLTLAEAIKLHRSYGGKVSEQTRLPSLPPPHAPIRVRGRLIVVATERERALVQASSTKSKTLFIPAGMAFGTGDHATTFACLRFVADVADELSNETWELLDLGTGTGILTLAARLLGARRADATDVDPHALRTAKDNARLNAISRVAVRKLDVCHWTPRRTWPVITANLYSALLIAAAPTVAAALAPKGHLIFSGILREQELEVRAALRTNGLRITRVVRRGKWVSGRAFRVGSAKTKA